MASGIHGFLNGYVKLIIPKKSTHKKFVCQAVHAYDQGATAQTIPRFCSPRTGAGPESGTTGLDTARRQIVNPCFVSCERPALGRKPGHSEGPVRSLSEKLVIRQSGLFPTGPSPAQEVKSCGFPFFVVTKEPYFTRISELPSDRPWPRGGRGRSMPAMRRRSESAKP